MARLSEQQRQIISKKSETKMVLVLNNLQKLTWERYDVIFKVLFFIFICYFIIVIFDCLFLFLFLI